MSFDRLIPCRNKTEARAYQDKEFSDVSGVTSRYDVDDLSVCADKDESESNQSLEVKTEVKVDMGLW